MTARDLSDFLVVRLNADKFPVTSFERSTCEHYGLCPVLVEAAGSDILRHAAEADALFVVSEALTSDVIDGLRHCRVISRMGAGTDKVAVEAATAAGIVVTNVPDFCVEEQADHTMALLLALLRKLPAMHQAMLDGKYHDARQQSRPLRRLSELTLGLVGFGRSARAVARRAAGFGMRILASRRSQTGLDAEARAWGVQLTDLDTVLAKSDCLSLHLPLTKESFHLLNADRLAAMKHGAVLINTSRGAIVDESALVESLRRGHLAAAGLDTFHEINVHEEKKSTHALLQLDNVICTPHVAAFSRESSRDVGVGAVENVAAVLLGRWPPADRVVNSAVQPCFALERPEQ